MDGVKLTRNQDSKLTFSELRMTFIGWCSRIWKEEPIWVVADHDRTKWNQVEPSETKWNQVEQEFNIEIEESLLEHK